MKSSPRLSFHFVQCLTLVRVPLIFLFLAVSVFSAQPPSWPAFVVAFGAMVLSAATDFLDGYFARRLGVTSRLGSYADPLVDKVFYLTAFPTLIYLAAVGGQQVQARLLILFGMLFLLRDQWVSFLRSLGALYRLDARANWSGKARTLISFPTLCVVYWYLAAPNQQGRSELTPVVYALEILSMLINLVSIFAYTRQFWPALRAELRPPAPGQTAADDRLAREELPSAALKAPPASRVRPPG